MEKISKLGIILILFSATWFCDGKQTGTLPKFTLEDAPNIILIIIDALRADKLGCYGFPEDISPEIDEMANKGILFENVLAQCSWTRPSVASMLTGLYPRSAGIYKEKYDILLDKYLTLAEILKNKGYQTFGITANPNTNKFFNFHQGFDDYQDSNIIWKWMKNEPGKEIADNDKTLPKSKEIFDTVLKKIESYKSRPVYIQITLMEVHSPYLLRDEYKNEFSDYPVRKTNKYPMKNLGKLVRTTLAAVKQSSHDIGKFVKKLQTIPGWENTLFVITSDHGQGLDDHPDVINSQGHGRLLYESQLRVPLIFYHPKSPHNRFKPHRIKNRVRLMDLMPTILDYVGITFPKNQDINGISLYHLISGHGKEPQLPNFFIAETNFRNVNKISVYSKNWKYFENRDFCEEINPRELQKMNVLENGKLTDKIKEEIEIATKMKRLLYQWEKKHKRMKRTAPYGKLSKKEIQQLKSIGYLN
jgi:arylsulfatase A-like enzyme